MVIVVNYILDSNFNMNKIFRDPKDRETGYKVANFCLP